MIVGAAAAGVEMWLVVLAPGVLWCLCSKQKGRIRPLARRMAPVGVFYAFYFTLVTWTMQRNVVARSFRNAGELVRIERVLHISWEPFLVRFALPGADAFYLWAQVVVMVALLTWCAVKESDALWSLARNTLALIAAGGFLCYWLLPMAPPRLLPASFHMGGGGLGVLSNVADQLGAFPSLHTAWAGWAALVLWAVWGKHKVLQWVGWGYLGLTVAVVLTTGNHYVLDVLAGEALALVSGFTAEWWAGYRLVAPAPRISPAVPAQLEGPASGIPRTSGLDSRTCDRPAGRSAGTRCSTPGCVLYRGHGARCLLGVRVPGL